MRLHGRNRKLIPTPAIALAALTVLASGLTACIPGNIQFGSAGVGFSSGGGAGVSFGLGSLFNLASSQGQGQQYSLPTATDGPHEVAATFHSEVDCTERLGLSLGSGFVDIAPDTGTAACFACPAGYVRGDPAVPATDPLGCTHPATVGLFQSAEALGPLGCDAGTFQIGDGCYSCPADMTPTGNQDVGTACLAE